jgi:uncharacterized protein with PhoU and TrkA domain
MEYYRHNYAGTGVWNSTLQTYYKQNEDGTYDKVNESIRLSGLMQNWAYMQALQNNPYWLLKQNTGIMVMLVEKPGQHARSAGPDTVIEPGDQLTVFGRYENIRRAFHARERFTDD